MGYFILFKLKMSQNSSNTPNTTRIVKRTVTKVEKVGGSSEENIMPEGVSISNNTNFSQLSNEINELRNQNNQLKISNTNMQNEINSKFNDIENCNKKIMQCNESSKNMEIKYNDIISDINKKVKECDNYKNSIET